MNLASIIINFVAKYLSNWSVFMNKFRFQICINVDWAQHEDSPEWYAFVEGRTG